MTKRELLGLLLPLLAGSRHSLGTNPGQVLINRVQASGGIDMRHSYLASSVATGSSVFVKTWGSASTESRNIWLASREILESRYRAPVIVANFEFPIENVVGLVLEFVDGSQPIAGSKKNEMTDLVWDLHHDDELYSILSQDGKGTTHSEYFRSSFGTRWIQAMGLISESDLTPVETPIEWMRDESRLLIDYVDGLDEFSTTSRSPVHGDFYEGNVLETSNDEWFVIDWDDLAIGDPAADLIKLVGRGNSALKRSILERYSDRHLSRRIRFYERATLLDKVIDGLADYLVLSREGDDALELRSHKLEAYRDGLDEYRMTYNLS